MWSDLQGGGDVRPDACSTPVFKAATVHVIRTITAITKTVAISSRSDWILEKQVNTRYSNKYFHGGPSCESYVFFFTVNQILYVYCCCGCPKAEQQIKQLRSTSNIVFYA